MSMTKDELRQYAEALLLEHARDIEFMSIFEMAEEHAPGGDITDDEAREVDSKLAKASITITWPDGVWS